ncbi:unnamed protein product [Caenorhabditis angaria]|uniref:C2H2-type domain-containing protein n=1 Tax=Caenorhabditis angaria TaxID=860376 RepID=A0A9P1ID34_9PELO|nr:unnamed protein product [Caenorhabditis angaria]
MSDDTSDDEEMNCDVEPSCSGELQNEEMKDEPKKEKRKYKCPNCDYMATFPNKLRIHVNVRHPSELRFSCKSCDMRFEEYIELRKHRQSNHPVIHKCMECDFEHKIKANVDKHFKTNHVNGVYCSFGCGKMFAKNQIKKHIAKFHSTDIEIGNIAKMREGLTEQILKCELCDYEADKLLKTEELKMEDLNIHISRIHGNGTKCPFECGKSYKVDDLINHIQTEHEQESDETEKIRNEDTVSTCIDVRIDEDENDISDSENEEDNEKGYTVDNKCSKCSKIFNCSQSLKRHIKSVHDKMYSKSKQVLWKECDFVENGKKCEKRFKCQSLLDDHLNKHRNIFPYKCQNCDQKFNARSRFAVHLSKYHKTSIKDYTLLINSVFRK